MEDCKSFYENLKNGKVMSSSIIPCHYLIICPLELKPFIGIFGPKIINLHSSKSEELLIIVETCPILVNLSREFNALGTN